MNWHLPPPKPPRERVEPLTREEREDLFTDDLVPRGAITDEHGARLLATVQAVEARAERAEAALRELSHLVHVEPAATIIDAALAPEQAP